MANGGAWPAIGIHEKSVRGTISNRLKTTKDQDPAKLDAAIENPNLQTVDVATLPNDSDTLRVRFTLRVLGGAGMPCACNNQTYQTKLQATVQGYVTGIGFAELAHRYAINLANGRFLWRNRVGAEEVAVEVRHLEKGQAKHVWRFNALDMSLRNFNVPAAAKTNIELLAASIEQGLAGATHVLLEVVKNTTFRMPH